MYKDYSIWDPAGSKAETKNKKVGKGLGQKCVSGGQKKINYVGKGSQKKRQFPLCPPSGCEMD